MSGVSEASRNRHSGREGDVDRYLAFHVSELRRSSQRFRQLASAEPENPQWRHAIRLVDDAIRILERRRRDDGSGEELLLRLVATMDEWGGQWGDRVVDSSWHLWYTTYNAVRSWLDKPSLFRLAALDYIRYFRDLTTRQPDRPEWQEDPKSLPNGLPFSGQGTGMNWQRRAY